MLVAGLALVGARASEPANLDAAKAQVVAYHDSGEYEQAIQEKINSAISFLEHYDRKSAHNPIVVLDIDETSLSNYEYMKGIGFGYEKRGFDAWVLSERAKAIPPTLQLFRKAKELGYTVYFVTGRRESWRAATQANLVHEGFVGYDGLRMRPDDDNRASVIPYKSGVRAELARTGVIVLNVGDQWSDLDGFQALNSVKLPDPFYLIP
jgi:acid phosphatase